jgi:protein disulfide-isomerase-like protein
VLTDSTFEHDTQAVTGATTGDWFVEFYAPWCGHCKRLEDTWEKLATKLKEDKMGGDVAPIIAKVDGTQEKALSERFKIQGFPTLLMFSKGKMYTYDGGRDFDSLYAWCKDGAYRASEGVPVPKGWDQMSATDKAYIVFETTIKKDMEQIWQYHKAAFFLALGLTFVLGLLLVTAPSSPRSAALESFSDLLEHCTCVSCFLIPV